MYGGSTHVYIGRSSARVTYIDVRTAPVQLCIPATLSACFRASRWRSCPSLSSPCAGHSCSTPTVCSMPTEVQGKRIKSAKRKLEKERLAHAATAARAETVVEAEAEMAETLAALAESDAEVEASEAQLAAAEAEEEAEAEAEAEAEVRRRADGADAAGADDADGVAGAAGADGADGVTVTAGADGAAKLLPSRPCRATTTVAKSDRDVLALVDATIAAGATVAATGAAKGDSKDFKGWGLSDMVVAQFVGSVTQQLRQRPYLV